MWKKERLTADPRKFLLGAVCDTVYGLTNRQMSPEESAVQAEKIRNSHCLLHERLFDGYDAFEKAVADHPNLIEHKDIHGRTPLTLALALHKIPEATALMDARANINNQCVHGNTPLIESIGVTWQNEDGMTDVTLLLLERKAEIDRFDITGSTALMLACHDGKVDHARILLDDPQSKRLRSLHKINNAGHTAFHIASTQKHTECMYLLAEYGAKPKHPPARCEVCVIGMKIAMRGVVKQKQERQREAQMMALERDKAALAANIDFLTFGDEGTADMKKEGTSKKKKRKKKKKGGSQGEDGTAGDGDADLMQSQKATEDEWDEEYDRLMAAMASSEQPWSSVLPVPAPAPSGGPESKEDVAACPSERADQGTGAGQGDECPSEGTPSSGGRHGTGPEHGGSNAADSLTSVSELLDVPLDALSNAIGIPRSNLMGVFMGTFLPSVYVMYCLLYFYLL